MRWLFYSLISVILLSCSSFYGYTGRKLKHYYISIETTACFGRCPILLMDVQGMGNASLDARRFVDSVGEFSMTLDPTQLRELTYASRRVGWDTLQKEYLSGYTDLPSRIIRFSVKAGDTAVVRYEKGEGPKELEKLGNLLYYIAVNDTAWNRVEGSMNR